MNNIKLNKEQQNAIEKIQNGGNYIILGKAGTGKTTLLHQLRQALPDAVFVTPTGNAARLIGGTTINSLFLIPSYPFITSWTLGVISSKKARKIISKIKTLVVDEISMVRSDIFAAIDCRLRQYGPPGAERLPFGGRQIILCGDFFQLPPVVTNDDVGEIQIEPYEFKKYAYRLVRDPVTGEERPVPFEIGRFRQLPVLSGYTLTIHKAQGMTLKSVALNRGKGCFSHGQCYVGISRVRRLDDLFLSAPLEIADVIVDPDVLQADRVFRDDPNLWRACVIHKLKELKHDERDYAGHLADWGTAILNKIAADYNNRFDAGEEPTNNEVDQKQDYLCRQLFLLYTGQARCSLNAVFKDLLKCLDL